MLDSSKFFDALGKRVRSLRKSRHYTQEDMMNFGFSARHWQQIEKGRPITMKTLLRITIALDVPLSQLVRGLPGRGPLAPELQNYLAMHDIDADRAAFAPVGNAVGAGLLAAANEFGCDLLVMGAYSHSRLRQLFLGGVTRHVLDRATIPVMMHR